MTAIANTAPRPRLFAVAFLVGNFTHLALPGGILKPLCHPTDMVARCHWLNNWQEPVRPSNARATGSKLTSGKHKGAERHTHEDQDDSHHPQRRIRFLLHVARNGGHYLEEAIELHCDAQILVA